MKKLVILLILVAIIFVGCEKKNNIMTYTGESLNWKVIYKIDGNEDSHNSYYTISYKGADAKSAGLVKCSIDGPKEGENVQFELPEQGEYRGKMDVTGGLPDNKDREIRVTLEWDGKRELLKLSK